ncbi:MAG: ATP synthase F1 subunit delta [candidate division Zixibacteria bacterium]|nr:ATP synthase F1 subunit delta [candidate division Zixibacteria bacterium]
MIAQEVAKKYASGLFLSVKEKGAIDQAYDQLRDLESFLATDPTFMNFLVAPHVLDEHKLTLVRDVFTDRIDRLFVEFLIVLVRKHRIGYLHEIIDKFVRFVEYEKGIARVTVITAVSLTDSERQNLTARLATRTGHTIKLEEKTDTEIMAGMIIILHNKIIDGSVRRGLDLIEGQLTRIRVH